MRTLTSTMNTRLSDPLALEPVVILKLDWGNGIYFSDKKVGSIENKILSISAVETSINIRNQQIAQVKVTLDDTSNYLKNLFEQINIHKIKARLYLHIIGTTLFTDDVLIFEGTISSPFEWFENERNVNFDIISKLETFDIGFSPEEGQFDFLNNDLVGKVWPTCFGNVNNVPCAKIKQVKSTTLLEDFGIVDPTLIYKINELISIYHQNSVIFYYWQYIIEQAEALAQPVSKTLEQFIQLIIKEDKAIDDHNVKLGKLNNTINLLQRDPKSELKRFNNKQAVKEFDKSNEEVFKVYQQKQLIYNLVELSQYEIDVQKQAAFNALEAYNKLKYLKGDIFELLKQYCLQKSAYKKILKVDPEHEFEKDKTLIVTIEGLEFKVKFEDDTCEILSDGPISTIRNLSVDTWKPDPEPCTDFDPWNGIDLFYIKNDKYNLENMYLLVEQKGTKQRHIVKVYRQIGTRVYINLTPWNIEDSASNPSNINIILDNLISANLGTFPGDAPVPLNVILANINPLAFNTPEGAAIVKILKNINRPISRTELETIIKLVFLVDYDNLSNIVLFVDPSPLDIYTIVGPSINRVIEASPIILEHWLNDGIPYEEIPEEISWSVSSGTFITDAEDKCEIYVCNTLPSTINGVYAYRTNDKGRRYKASIPSRYYEKRENQSLGPMNLTCLIFKQPLTSYAGENWEEDVYVSLTSSIGPNPIEVMEYLINTFLPGTTHNFDIFLKSKMDKYPVNYALLGKKDVLTELLDICQQSRLALSITNNELKLTYLSEKQDNVLELNEGNVIKQDINFTNTENLITVDEVIYFKNYLPDKKPNKLIVRNNINIYGIHHQNSIYHCFKHYSLVEKTATFWIIRNSNTWKYLQITMPINFLALEVNDIVRLNFLNPIIPNVDAQILSIVTDLEEQVLILNLQTGIRSGENSQYEFFWPANLDPSIELNDKSLGSFGPYKDVTGTIEC